MPRYYPVNAVEARLYERRDKKRRPELYPRFVLRCPACDSTETLSQTAFVDETGTFALTPSLSHPSRIGRTYRYQEYRSRVCIGCEFRWHTEPTGRWSTRSDTYSGEPYDPRPCLVQDEAGFPVRERQDFRRATRVKAGRFTDVSLADPIVNSPLIVFTGAGASVPFGFPSAKGFRWADDTSDYILGDVGDLLCGDILRYGTMSEFLLKAPNVRQRTKLAVAAVTDVEIRLEVLLRLQDLIIQEGGDEGFEQVRSDLGNAFTSWFLFGDFLKEEEYAAPPLTTMLQTEATTAITKSSEYFRLVRKILERTCRHVISSCAVPSSEGRTSAKKTVLPFLAQLQAMVGGSLPIYTTNYDLTIEYLLGNELVDGFDYEHPRRDAYYESERVNFPIPRVMFKPDVWHECGRFALFHLHGASNYFVDPRTAECFSVDSNQELIEVMHEVAWTSEIPCVLGAVAPATCKERYLYAPHFGVPYDYLAQGLTATKYCVMIGYSCRDEIIKETIARALSINKDLFFLVIGFGAPSPHFLDVVPEDRFAYWDAGFNEAACSWVLKGFHE